ncbi:hypothetical protein NDU88_006986 [Pleurodeles waltl]|uniref:Uncharacterized protein n=1 Tax=Pleurodeles waltl TaxID=8319 RepID=A0AAV7UMM5_PLEWA|nr:hypothetical protein NDU88_006986 [Pleurodeles waltl]
MASIPQFLALKSHPELLHTAAKISNYRGTSPIHLEVMFQSDITHWSPRAPRRSWRVPCRRTRPRLVSLLPGALGRLLPRASSARRCFGEARGEPRGARDWEDPRPRDRAATVRLNAAHHLSRSCRYSAGPFGAPGAARRNSTDRDCIGTPRPAVLPSQLDTIFIYTNRTASESFTVAPHGAGIPYLTQARPDCAEAPEAALNSAQRATCGGGAADVLALSGETARGIPCWAPGTHACRSVVELHSSRRHSSTRGVEGDCSLPLGACSSVVDNRGIGVWETPPLALPAEQVHSVAPDPRRLVHSRPAPSPLIHGIYNILKD